MSDEFAYEKLPVFKALHRMAATFTASDGCALFCSMMQTKEVNCLTIQCIDNLDSPHSIMHPHLKKKLTAVLGHLKVIDSVLKFA